ncbi:MAG: tyrosine--tRNA ligase [Myxococcota bacterium]
MHVIDTLKARGFYNQCTDEEGLRKRMDEGPLTFYVGFDPTADSLHVGHLVQVMAMANLHRAGHRAIAVVGGGTAQVGDPSFRDETRELMTAERMAHNKLRIAAQLAKFAPGEMVDNADWLMPLNYVEFIRDIGRHFSVNVMVKAESMKQRLERGQGLSFLEFNYPLLQAYDFLELYRRYKCVLQVGGGDQWFNIVSGMDLIRRIEGGQAFGLTTPLLTTATGAKMGKTAAGAVWLDAEKVTPFDYRQYWYNCDDRDIGRFLRLFTFLPLDEIEEIEKGDFREAKKRLAEEATRIVHGDWEVPSFATALPRKVIDVLVESKLATSKSEARRLVDQGGVTFDDTRIDTQDASVTHPGVLRAGKKKAVRVCLT